eukprot:IDg4998t1
MSFVVLTLVAEGVAHNGAERMIGTRAEVKLVRCRSRPGTTTGVARTESTVVSRGGLQTGWLSKPSGVLDGKHHITGNRPRLRVFGRARQRLRGRTAPAGELRQGEEKG